MAADKHTERVNLPPIPAKRYFTIGEVSALCDVKPHVLRYWEQEFPQLKPTKRRGNRRYYQRQDIIMIRQIRALLYEQGFTIGGARLQLGSESAKDDVTQFNMLVKQMLSELEDILKKDGKAELVCEFCKNKYFINYEEIKSMIQNQS